MPNVTHRNVRFTAAEMAENAPRDTDFSKMRYLGRGSEGLEMGRRISQARGAAKRKLIEALPRMAERHAAAPCVDVKLDPDVAKFFPTAKDVNDTLRLVAKLFEVGAHKNRKTA